MSSKNFSFDDELHLILSLELLFFCFHQGYLVPNRATFPSGIKALADYVHSKGLMLGIYSDAG